MWTPNIFNLSTVRNKQNNTMADMGEQIDCLNKHNGKAYPDKAETEHHLQGLDEATPT